MVVMHHFVFTNASWRSAWKKVYADLFNLCCFYRQCERIVGTISVAMCLLRRWVPEHVQQYVQRRLRLFRSWLHCGSPVLPDFTQSMPKWQSLSEGGVWRQRFQLDCFSQNVCQEPSFFVCTNLLVPVLSFSDKLVIRRPCHVPFKYYEWNKTMTQIRYRLYIIDHKSWWCCTSWSAPCLCESLVSFM